MRIWESFVLLSFAAALAVSVPGISYSTDKDPDSSHIGLPFRSVPIKLGNKTVNAVVADSHQLRVQGLLGWASINEDAGMLLDFIVPGNYAIHMQGMKFPIDAIWIDSNGAIKLVYDEIPPDSGKVYPSLFSCRYCLEVQAGLCKKYGIKSGQNIAFMEQSQ